MLENVNLCNPSVLDRLNPLLEPNGTLYLNECGTGSGSARVITPHPDFRLFLTLDPKHGEVSRAMRNRGIELYLLREGQPEGASAPASEESSWSRELVSVLGTQGIPGSDAPQAMARVHGDVVTTAQRTRR
jgi:midasin